MPELKPAAIVRSRHGDPEAFGERWLEVIIDIQSMPYGAKLYAIPADQILVPRRLLEAIEKTWRIPHPQGKPFNELGERAIEEGLRELRTLLLP